MCQHHTRAGAGPPGAGSSGGRRPQRPRLRNLLRPVTQRCVHVCSCARGVALVRPASYDAMRYCTARNPAAGAYRNRAELGDWAGNQVHALCHPTHQQTSLMPYPQLALYMCGTACMVPYRTVYGTILYCRSLYRTCHRRLMADNEAARAAHTFLHQPHIPRHLRACNRPILFIDI